MKRKLQMTHIQSSKVDTTDFDELFARGHARSAQLENSAFDQSGQPPPLSFDMDAARRFQQGGNNEAEKLGTPFEIFSKEAAFKQSRKGAGIGYEEKVQSFLHDQQGREYHGGGDSAGAPQKQSAPPPGRPGRMQDQLVGDRGRQQRQQQEQLPFGGQVPAAQGTAAKPRYKLS